MYCTGCGSQCLDDAQFCNNCGQKMNQDMNQAATNSGNNQFQTANQNYYNQNNSNQNQNYNNQNYSNQNQNNNNQNYNRYDNANANYYSNYQNQPNYASNFNAANIPEEYRPISMWGYFGYQLLFAIPLVGFVLIIVFSFGATPNQNLRNFARSYFCLLIIAAAIALLMFLFVFSMHNRW